MRRDRKLLPASFKGVPFLVRSEVLTKGGRRLVLHEYPNSSDRFVEDLGELPPAFTVTAFVTGDDFLDRAAQLERALTEEGKGRLSMPTFGARTLYAAPYRKDASQTEVGEIKFYLDFVAGRSISGPTKAPKTPQTVYAQGDAARTQIGTALETAWIEPTETSNVQTAEFDLNQAAASIQLLKTSVNNSQDLTTIVDFINSNSPSIVRDASAMNDTLINKLWQNVSVGLSGGSGVHILQDLTRFGSGLSLSLADIRGASISDDQIIDESTDIPLWSATTGGRNIRNQNRLSLVNAARVAALVSAYEQAADTAYNTDTEIEETRLSLEENHQRLMRVDTNDKTLIQSQPRVRRAVEDIRLSTLDVLDQKEQAAFTLVTIENQTPVSSFVLAYQLYAEILETDEDLTNKGLEIRELNPTLPADKLIGDTTVLQS